MPKPLLADAILRSGVLAIVTAALIAPLSLLAGAVIFYARARLGWVDPTIGFEPNVFLRQFALPLSAGVLVVTFILSLWHARPSNMT